MHRKTNPQSVSQADGEKMAAKSGEGKLPAFITAQPDGVLLAIKLQPRASRNEIGEPLGNELRVKVTAPPVDSAAPRLVPHAGSATFASSSGSGAATTARTPTAASSAGW